MALRSKRNAPFIASAGLIAVVVLAGCSSNSSSSSSTTTAPQSPAELARAAATTMAKAPGLSATGTIGTGGSTYHLVVVSDRAGSTSLTMVQQGTAPSPEVSLVAITGHTYFKFNEAFISTAITAHDKLSAAQNAQIKARLANTWFDTATSPVFATISSLSTIMGGFLASGLETGLGTRVTNTAFSVGSPQSINGQQAIPLTAPDKSVLWITQAPPQTLIRIAGPTGSQSDAYDLTYPSGVTIETPSPVTTFRTALGAGLFAAVLAAFSAAKG